MSHAFRLEKWVSCPLCGARVVDVRFRRFFPCPGCGAWIRVKTWYRLLREGGGFLLAGWIAWRLRWQGIPVTAGIFLVAILPMQFVVGACMRLIGLPALDRAPGPQAGPAPAHDDHVPRPLGRPDAESILRLRERKR